MMRPVFALSWVVVLATPAFGQPDATGGASTPPSADQRCEAVVIARMGGDKTRSGKNCEVLATMVTTKILDDAREAAKHTAVDPGLNPNQPSITDTPGAQVSAGQTAAVASGQPVGSAGGSVAAVGATGQGLELVTALAINPGTIATGDTDTHAVWLSRFADLSIVVPANVQPADGVTKGFSYIGGRLRLNVAAAFESSSLETRRDRAVERYSELQATLASTMPEIKKILDSPDPSACEKALENADTAAQNAACKAVFDRATLVPTVQTARQALADFRSEADRRYLSVEARFDRGDLNADAAARKDTLFAAYLAGGYTFSPRSEGTALTLRTRGGAVFFEDGMTARSKVAGFGAIGAELGFTRDMRHYALSVGLELYTKQAKDDPMLSIDQRNAFKLGVVVPVADGKNLSLGLTIPTEGGDPILAVSGDWSLLLSNSTAK
jgi:hypothetical protein